MILVDTGPLVALFDPQDPDFAGCHAVLSGLDQPLYTTDAVLTDAFHLLAPASRGAEGLMRFVAERYVALIGLEHADHLRAFELMAQYADRPMDYADGSVVVVAERLETLQVFTLDTGDFATCQIKKGQRYYSPIIVG